MLKEQLSKSTLYIPSSSKYIAVYFQHCLKFCLVYVIIALPAASPETIEYF